MGDPSIADRLSLRLLSCLILSLRPKASNRKVREESQNANQDCGPVFLRFSRLSSPSLQPEEATPQALAGCEARVRRSWAGVVPVNLRKTRVKWL